MAAVRVPPSACSTSQSSVIVRSPSACAVDARAQAAADQALDFHRASALAAACGFALAARVGGARQHAVFGGDPAFALATQPCRRAVLDAGRAQHAGIAEAHQHRTFGVTGVMAFDAYRAQLIAGAAAWAGDGIHWIGRSGRAIGQRGSGEFTIAVFPAVWTTR